MKLLSDFKNSVACIEYGKKISDLVNLFLNDFSVDLTYVISTENFKTCIENNEVDTYKIGDLSERIIDVFNSYDFLDIKSSQCVETYGIPNFEHVRTDKESISKAIFKVYNSWFESKAKSFRITYSISEEESYPAIYIQPNREKVETYVTRCPKTGKYTNESNSNNIHNTLAPIPKIAEKLFEQLEFFLKVPVKFHFLTEKDKIVIRDLEKELMTQHAYWIAINDLYFKRIIDDIGFINLLKPQMIYEKSGISLTGNNNEEYSSIDGLPASPGISIGSLVFSNSDNAAFDNYSIFCCIEMTPEDLDNIDRSIGAISSRGGMTSHLACVSRGIGIPAVTGAPFSIDFKRKELIIGDKIFPEKSYVAVDGNTGSIVVSKNPINVGQNYKANSSYEYLLASYNLLKKVGKSDSFKNHTLKFQMQVAELLSAFNKINFES